MNRMFQGTVLALAFVGSSLLAQDGRCIAQIYRAGEPRNTSDFEFDRTFPGDAKGAYSCSLGMRPSAMRKALEQFRFGVLYNDATSIKSVIRFPVSAHVSKSLGVDAKTTTVTIHNVNEWFAFQEKYFSKAHTALVACAFLGNVTPMGGRSPGVMIGLGAFWFQSFVGSWKVRLTAVNLFPINADMVAKSCTPPGVEGN